MLVAGFPAEAFGTNCYVAAQRRGGDCVIVDPGIGVLEPLSRLLRELEVRPVAVLLTHGHLDHVYSVTPVCRAHDIPALIHADDDYRLDDPIRSLDPMLVSMLEQQFGQSATWARPSDVRTATDGEKLTLAGMDFSVIHAPGHTEGSAMFAVDAVPDGLTGAGVADLHRTLLSGDVLFAGSIGRTDLPGGSHEAMLNSLRTKVLTQPDGTLVLPGHGSETTIARERATNPFLANLN